MAKRQNKGRSEGGRNRNTVSRRGTTSGTSGKGSSGGRGSTRTAGGRTRTGGGGTTKAAGGTKSRGGSRTTNKVGTRGTGSGKKTASSGSQTAGRRATGAAGKRGQSGRSSTSNRTNQETTRQQRMTNRGASTSGGRSRTRKQQDQTRAGGMEENRNETGTQTDHETGDQESIEEELYQRTTDYKRDIRESEDVFAQTVQKSNLWLKQVMAELGTDDKHRAYTALKSVLQALRDRLTVEEATDLAAQMPTLIRGIFFEGWKPADKPIKYNREEFTDRIGEHFRNLSGINHAEIIRAVFRTLQQNIPEGEINHIIGTMPEEFEELWMQDELVG